MPHVRKEARYVKVAYELMCGFKRATALADDAEAELAADEGLESLDDDTRGWDGERMAVIVATYRTMADAMRLDAKVRELLSRRADFTYTPHCSTGYSAHGGHLVVRSSTTLKPMEV